MTDKKTIREHIINIRKELDEEYITKCSNIIIDKLVTSLIYKKAQSVMSYVSFIGEVDTKKLLNLCINDSKTLTVPLITPTYKGNKSMEAACVMCPDDELVPGIYGIYAPSCNAKVLSPSDIDMVIVPGVAFDIQKHRVGMGMGYYDRFMSLLTPECIKVGLAFNFQIFNRVPYENHDVSLDIIITDQDIIT